jgi:hypothetical protein
MGRPFSAKPEGWEEAGLADVSLLEEIIRSIRKLCAEKRVAPAKLHLSIVDALAAKPADTIVLVVGSLEVYIPLAGIADLDEQRARLERSCPRPRGRSPGWRSCSAATSPARSRRRSSRRSTSACRFSGRRPKS